MWRSVKGDRLSSGLSPFCFFLMGRLRCGVACPGAEIAGGTGCPSRLCQEGKRELTESAKEFPKASAWQSPKGPFREALERRGMLPRDPDLEQDGHLAAPYPSSSSASDPFLFDGIP